MSRPFISSFLTLLTALACPGKDQILLENGDQFIGKVIALKDGIIEIESPHSLNPLAVYNKDLKKLVLEENETTKLDEKPSSSEFLTLQNGDCFPGQMVSLNETHLNFSTHFAGLLTIPRNLISDLAFGVVPQPLIYHGPEELDQWTFGQRNSWTIMNGSLSSSDKGLLGKDLPLPENFIFKAQYFWGSELAAQIQLAADPPTEEDGDILDGYQISLTDTKITIHRLQSAKDEAPKQELLLSQKVTHSPNDDGRTELEIRVNRREGEIELELDGQKLALAVDPDPAPTGSSFAIEQLHSSEAITIEDLKIYEWDTKTTQLLAAEKNTGSTDRLILLDKDRHDGTVLQLDASSDTPQLMIKSSQSIEKIPLKYCSRLQFAKAKIKDPNPTSSYLLNLNLSGRLSLNEIKMKENELVASHPWLGPLTLSRHSVATISRNP